MSWRCTGKSNLELIQNMAKNAIFNSPRVELAMVNVDRANYVRNKAEAYQDSPQYIRFIVALVPC